MTKLPHLILALTIMIAALLLFGLLREEPAAGHGVPHPGFAQAQLNHGGEAARHDNLLVVGGLYGGLQIVLLVAGLSLAIRRDRSSVMPLIIAGAAYSMVYVAMVVTYAKGMDNAPIVLGLPLPTALMVIGMWGVPAVFAVLYVVKFRDWVYNDDDARKLAELLRQSVPDGAEESPTHG